MSCLEGTVTLLHTPTTASVSRIGSSIEMSATKALGLESEVQLLRSLIDCGLTMERVPIEGALTMLTKPMSASCSLVCSMLYMIVKRGVIHLDYLGNPVEWEVKANTEWSAAPIEQWQKGKIYIESDADSATFSSDINEGIDRKVAVVFSCEDAEVERTLEQEGLRQQFRLKGGGVWRVRGSGRFGVLKESKLQHTEIAYLGTSGTQWINSNIKSPLKVEAILQGTRSSNSSRIVLSLNGVANAGAWFGFTTVWTLGSTITFGNAYDEIVDVACVFDGSKIDATIDGVTKSRSGARSGSLYIGAANSTYASYCRIYSAKIYKDDVLVRDFTPVLDSNNVACMYDNVSGEYFYNQGTGEFIAGL